MSDYQKYKVTHIKEDGEGLDIFFVDRAFDSALDQVKRYLNNINHEGITYYRNEKWWGPQWLPLEPQFQYLLKE